MFPTTLMEGKRHTVLELRARRERLFTDGMELPVKIVVRDFPPVFKLLKGIIVSSISSTIMRKAGLELGIFSIYVYLGAAYVYTL